MYKQRPKVYKIIRRLGASYTKKIRLPEVDAREAVKYFAEIWSTDEVEFRQMEEQAKDTTNFITMEDQWRS